MAMAITTRMLIQLAYDVPLGSSGRVIGGPGWINSDIYVIQAKISDDLRAKQEAMPQAERRAQSSLMDQSLLADRFKLKAHFETREMPVYELVVAKGGPKLALAAKCAPACSPPAGSVRRGASYRPFGAGLTADNHDLEGTGFGLRTMAGLSGQHFCRGQENLLRAAIEAHGAGARCSRDGLGDRKVAVLFTDDGERAITATGERLATVEAGGVIDGTNR